MFLSIHFRAAANAFRATLRETYDLNWGCFGKMGGIPPIRTMGRLSDDAPRCESHSRRSGGRHDHLYENYQTASARSNERPKRPRNRFE